MSTASETNEVVESSEAVEMRIVLRVPLTAGERKLWCDHLDSALRDASEKLRAYPTPPVNVLLLKHVAVVTTGGKAL